MISLKVGTASDIQNSPFQAERLAVAHDTGEVYYDLEIGSTEKRIKTGGTQIITSSIAPIGGYNENDIWFKLED